MWTTKAYLPLLLLALATVLGGGIIQLVWLPDSSFDILISNTYFVVAFFHVYAFLALYILFQTIIYFVMNMVQFRMNRIMTMIHSATLVLFIGFVFGLFKGYPGFSWPIAVLFFLNPLLGITNAILSKKNH